MELHRAIQGPLEESSGWDRNGSVNFFFSFCGGFCCWLPRLKAGEGKSWDGEKASDRYFSKAAEMVGIGQGRGGKRDEAGREERRVEK